MYLLKFSDEPKQKIFYKYAEVVNIYGKKSESLNSSYLNNSWLVKRLWDDDHVNLIDHFVHIHIFNN